MKLNFNNLDVLEQHPLVRSFEPGAKTFHISKDIGDHTTIINEYVTLYTSKDLSKLQANYESIKQRKKEHGLYYLDDSLTEYIMTIPSKAKVIAAIQIMEDHTLNTFRYLELLYAYKDNNDQIIALREMYKSMYHHNRLYRQAQMLLDELAGIEF